MVKLEWGEKHLCSNCSAKFYDMRQVKAICPSCGTKIKTPNYTTGVSKPKPNLKEVATGATEEPMSENTTDEDITEDNITAVEEDDDMSSMIDTEAVATQKDEN